MVLNAYFVYVRMTIFFYFKIDDIAGVFKRKFTVDYKRDGIFPQMWRIARQNF